MKVIAKHNVRLGEAMNVPKNSSFLYWFTLGLHVDLNEKEVEIVNGFTTGVHKKNENEFCVVVSGDSKQHSVAVYITIGDFSSLEEIQEKYPQLFELEGHVGYLQLK